MNSKGDGILPLTKREELLLMAYLDGEAGRWERFLASRLLSKSKSARDFISRTKGVSAAAADLLRPEEAERPLDNWPGVLQRIRQEEKAAVLLGSRKVDANAFGRLAGASSRVLLEVFGVAAVAVVALLVVTIDSRGGAPALLTTGSERFSLAGEPGLVGDEAKAVALPASYDREGTEADSESRSFFSLVRPARRGQQVIEVDWMRSKGHVAMLRNGEQNIPIFWVKKNNQGYHKGQLSSSSSSEIRLVENSVPSARSAYDH